MTKLVELCSGLYPTPKRGGYPPKVNWKIHPTVHFTPKYDSIDDIRKIFLLKYFNRAEV